MQVLNGPGPIDCEGPWAEGWARTGVPARMCVNALEPRGIAGLDNMERSFTKGARGR